MRISSQYFPNYAITEMNRKQESIARLQEQIASGNRLLTPADDPSQLTATENMDAAILRMDQYATNGVLTTQRLSQEETVLDNITDALQRLKEISIASKSSVVTATRVDAFRKETDQIFNQLLDYANTRTANGDYLFAGSKVQTRPFTRVGDSVVYQGDQTLNRVRISDSRTVISNDSGDQIFQRIANGNGYYSVSAAGANGGTGVIYTGSVVDPAAYSAETFTIEFTAPDEFSVLDGSGAAVLSGQSYTSGEAIRFNGIQVRIEGAPVARDRFSVSPSVSQDLFTTVQQLADAFESKPATPQEMSRYTQALNGVLENLDQSLDHIQTRRSSLGSRIGYIENTVNENESTRFHLTQTRSKIEDTDYNEAISDLQAELTTLEALRQTYAKIESMSLFDYLR